MSVVIFLAVLFVLILVHEWGHFIVAKKTGMRVDEFGIGFPPKLFGVKKGETEYTLNAFPIGGFVKILGENSDINEDQKDFRRSFTAKNRWAQAAVLIAGVTMNVLFAWFLFVIVLMAGVPASVSEAEASPEARLIVTEVLPEGPAALASLPLGSEVKKVTAGADQNEFLTPTAFAEFVSSHPEAEIKIVYEQGGVTETVSVTPQTGLLENNPQQPVVGVALSLVETIKQPFHVALFEATKRTFTTLVAITVGISSLLADALFLNADLSQVAGPVGIVGLVGDAAQFGFISLLIFTAVISLNLAVINMLPFPALDGGRLLMVAVEAIIRRPINPVWVSRLNMVGFALLILLMVAVTYNDVNRLF